jgi:hypothetical protein
MRSALKKRMATALINCPRGSAEHRIGNRLWLDRWPFQQLRLSAGLTMLVRVSSTRYKVWLELTALESTAFRIREANGATASMRPSTARAERGIGNRLWLGRWPFQQLCLAAALTGQLCFTYNAIFL